MRIRRLLHLLGPHGKIKARFGQWGEDVIVHRNFDKQKQGFYVDIGAHHPFAHSNTARLWLRGWTGVNVDANRKSVDILRRVRRQDRTIWAAVVSDNIAAERDTIDFFATEQTDLTGTVVPEMASDRGKQTSITVPCRSVASIIEESAELAPNGIDFMNIDIEGMDEEAIASLAEWPQKPRMIAIETYAQTIPDVMQTETFRIMSENGYDFRFQVGLTSIYMRKDFHRGR
ncbi:FkbM family methyltransferase [Hoeflea halophila]|uniref:FkbM family methyltransferase n=1 Tax=Hoeflea halophila TaxID=714899 RepID=A0A286IEP3_9HYPH|nr:FkbM family methyltransferase [Hoeflea halophila]SOE18588.1 FkbM family methyltransferase [Hoeflea halophila]